MAVRRTPPPPGLKRIAPPAVLTGPWQSTLETLVSSAKERLILCAPYISEHGADTVRAARRGMDSDSIAVLILTDLSPLAVCSGATDPAAVALLGEALPNVRTIHLPRLHAKVYAADGVRVVVTSGNLTHGGLRANHECGLYSDDAALVGRIEQELNDYAALGAEVDALTLAKVCDLAADARTAYKAQIASASRVSARRLQTVMQSASDTLVRARLAQGSLHGVLAKTIEFLLHRYGPLTTEQMNPMIQKLHPDLCDDTVDRVIDGKRFGKKWKHAARSAQQQLKRAGIVVLRNGRWQLVME